MKTKGILLNTNMIQAILDGKKSVIRIAIKPQPDKKYSCSLGFVADSTEKKDIGCFCFGTDEFGGSIECIKPPYHAGDILYIRETWSEWEGGYLYKAWTHGIHQPGEFPGMKWYPSVHMPKEAARIWLKVKAVRVERLQDINDEQAKAEGANWKNGKNVGFEEKMRRTAVERFAEIWDSNIKKSDLDRYGWDANPYVWVMEFERSENQND